jgi:hypothetical protein
MKIVWRVAVLILIFVPALMIITTLTAHGVQPAALGIALGFALAVTIWLDVTHGKGSKSSSD